MRFIAPIVVAAVLLAVGVISFRLWQSTRMWPLASSEVTTLDESKRNILERLRAERKFQPDDHAPLYYTGAENPMDEATGRRAVDGVIDTVLSRSDGPLEAKLVSDCVGSGMRQVRLLATEDRDRTQAYMLEIWYLLGFKGATGRFAYGSSYKPPPGYGEPLPGLDVADTAQSYPGLNTLRSDR